MEDSYMKRMILAICISLIFLGGCQSNRDDRDPITFLKEREFIKESEVTITLREHSDTLKTYAVQLTQEEQFTLYITEQEDGTLYSIIGICVNNNQQAQEMFKKIAIEFLAFHEFKLSVGQQKEFASNIYKVELRDFTEVEYTNCYMDYHYGMQGDIQMLSFSYYLK